MVPETSGSRENHDGEIDAQHGVIHNVEVQITTSQVSAPQQTAIDNAQHTTQDSLTEAPKEQDSVITSQPDDAPDAETSHLQEIYIIPGMKAGKADLTTKAYSYVASIMDSSNTDIERLECPAPATDRYDYLKWENSNVTAEYDDKSGKVKPRYLIALDLYKCVDLLPRLMGTIVEAVNWLGPANVVISVVEDDGTYEVLALLAREFVSLGVQYHLSTNEINPVDAGGDRIEALASLRNEALLPLTSNPGSFSTSSPILIFINDVSLCLEDILELLHQQALQSMDMACAMDWIGDGTLFYDVWVSRSMLGQIFFEIPQDGTWGFAGNLFYDDPTTRHRRDARQPFQVYACWNGVSVIRAEPFLLSSSPRTPNPTDTNPTTPLRFRRNSHETGECFMGEPTLLCKDLWRLNYTRIAVIPSVNVGYDDKASWHAKDKQGTVRQNLELAEQAQTHGRVGTGWLSGGGGSGLNGPNARKVVADGEEGKVNGMIEWVSEPPGLVKCLPDFWNVSWVHPLWP